MLLQQLHAAGLQDEQLRWALTWVTSCHCHQAGAGAPGSRWEQLRVVHIHLAGGDLHQHAGVSTQDRGALYECIDARLVQLCVVHIHLAGGDLHQHASVSTQDRRAVYETVDALVGNSCMWFTYTWPVVTCTSMQA